MFRRCHLKEVIHYKVINGEVVAEQHRVLVMDWEIQRGGGGEEKTRTGNAKDTVVEIKGR